MTTSRTSAASPPVTGPVAVTFEGKTVGKNQQRQRTSKDRFDQLSYKQQK